MKNIARNNRIDKYMPAATWDRQEKNMTVGMDKG